ncbi:plant SNARE 11-like isoform X2 [Canna indica]|uniref:Plant SNARE 11-like isoform X2 n=1 Tax=Canna indica TaxID=4628 RepID=A0AAQ3Q2H1_9LILI|nr:plant SNARE 11-like isoform X2 [Canna indica]
MLIQWDHFQFGFCTFFVIRNLILRMERILLVENSNVEYDSGKSLELFLCSMKLGQPPISTSESGMLDEWMMTYLAHDLQFCTFSYFLYVPVVSLLSSEILVVEETINVGAETSTVLEAQTEQMLRVVNELDSIHFSMKKASQLVKEIGRQLVHPNTKDIHDIPGLAPLAKRKLL